MSLVPTTCFQLNWSSFLGDLGLVWFTGSGRGKRHFLGGGEKVFCLVGVLKGERIEKVFSWEDTFYISWKAEIHGGGGFWHFP